MGTATHIAIRAINPVPANKGTAPNALPNSLVTSGVKATEASLTNAFCGLQSSPNKKSKILI